MLNTASTSLRTNRVCLSLAVGLVFFGAALNIFFLFNHCPFQLSQDEAHYWQWSRQLDYGYYSKPPGIAWLMAGTIKIAAIFGVDPNAPGQYLMPILRLPTVLFGLLSGLLSIALARRLFRDDRTALAVICLSAAVPMFAVGSLLITIDAPMYLCWSITVYCLWRYVERFSIFDFRFSILENPQSKIENRKYGGGAKIVWLYLAAFACAVGMLFKPVLIAIPLCVLVGCYLDEQIRRAFKSLHTVAGILIVLASQIPVIVWNAHHGWVTFRHIGAQGGLAAEAKPANFFASFTRLGEYIGGQTGGMGGLLFVLLVVAVVIAIKLRKVTGGQGDKGPASPCHPVTLSPCHLVTSSSLAIPYSELKIENIGLNFLLAFTLPLWLFYLALSLWKGTEPNWPAASYFTGMILLAGIFTAGWNSSVAATRRWWRLWGSITIAWGILLVAVAMNLHRFYPLFPSLVKIDPAAIKLRGFEERAATFQAAREKLAQETGQEPILLANAYGPASSLAFYLPDHPFVYCLMSSTGGRHNQFDLWPGPNQTNAAGTLLFAGRPALILGISATDPAVEKLLRPAFDRLEGPDDITPTLHGIPGKKIPLYRGYGFKGFPNISSNTY